MFTEVEHKSLLHESEEWRKHLADYRQKIYDLKNELYYFAPGKMDAEVWTCIEHFHNVFHIQLINIHDLKHEIRNYILETEKHPTFGHNVSHRRLKDKYEMLLHDLDQLEEDFHRFIKG